MRDISLKDAVTGKVDTISVETAVICGECYGLGTSPDSIVERCPHCRGDGTNGEKNCKTCTGFGTLIENPCPGCVGDGRVVLRRSIAVTIPAGISTGMRIRLSEQGETGPGGGPAGDVYLEINELPDNRFERRGVDLHCTPCRRARISASPRVR
ncbi:DnaJ C-terminal domain-containing protein [Allokutzneria albata]|uniref:DnaJ C-terminal domain-containing protein n=1 Tax=Allokutzneria albata TaxID=211114 RepID=UPI000B2AAC86|nr:DnaJ C-terminal domain-containing protein [Allokutzneria albata]